MTSDIVFSVNKIHKSKQTIFQNSCVPVTQSSFPQKSRSSRILTKLWDRKYENFLIVPINMMYYVFESPYKIVVNTDGEFTTYSSTPRKVRRSKTSMYVYQQKNVKKLVISLRR